MNFKFWLKSLTPKQKQRKKHSELFEIYFKLSSKLCNEYNEICDQYIMENFNLHPRYIHDYPELKKQLDQYMKQYEYLETRINANHKNYDKQLEEIGICNHYGEKPECTVCNVITAIPNGQ